MSNTNTKTIKASSGDLGRLGTPAQLVTSEMLLGSQNRGQLYQAHV